MLRRLALLTVVAALCLSGAYAQDRVSASEKGSLLVFPKVEIRWTAGGTLIQDTFISISNDYNQAVQIEMFFISETCTSVDNDIELTKNQPTYWAASTGLPHGVSPFTVLGDPYPDPDGLTTDLVLRGFIIMFAVDENIEQIDWNHLFGEATIVNYADGSAWEYNAYAFQALQGETGDVVGEPGKLELDGYYYDYGFSKLVLNFFASDSTAFSGGGKVVMHDTDLTLVIADINLKQESDGPFTTKAKFYIWNENEVSFSGMEYCFTKWDESLLSQRGGHFLVGNLQTNKGKAVIDGMKSSVCDPLESKDVVILGVAAKVLVFDGTETAYAGTHLVGTGTESTKIKYDVPDPSEEKKLQNREVQPSGFVPNFQLR